MNETLGVLSVIALAVVISVIPRFVQPKRCCPHCKSTRIQELARESIDVTFYNYGSGYGGHSTVQQRFKVTRQCAWCYGTWTVEVTEAS